MNCRFLFLAMLLCAACLPTRGQGECTLYGGVGMPVLDGENVPELRVSLVTGLQGGYALGGGWVLTGEVWQVRQVETDIPDITAVPLDTAFHVKRYQLIPLMLGVGYRFPLCDWASGRVHAGLGGCFRYINCQQQTSLEVIDDLGESGWGFAGKASVEVTLWRRVSLQVWFLATGSLAESGGWTAESKSVTFNRSHWHIEGYRQSFWGCSLGYIF